MLVAAHMLESHGSLHRA